MPKLILKALDCERPHGGSLDVNVRLEVSVDDGQEKGEVELGTVTFRERNRLAKSFLFSRNVEVRLKFRIDKQIGHTFELTTEMLPHVANGMRGLHRGLTEFKGISKKGAHYYLYYEVLPDGVTAAEFHRNALLSVISLRETLGRTGRGALTGDEYNNILRNTKYRCSEVISLQDTFALHHPQDGEKSNTSSLREWIAQHCNPWGEASVIPHERLPDGARPRDLAFIPNWRPVTDETSYVLAGFVTEGEFADIDNPFTHMTRDWNHNVIPSPAFNYMLAYTARTKGNTFVPISHNEWESGSMPVDWRPEVGEFVTIWGRHVFDLGHGTMRTEVHPPHTIVRECTLADGQFNRARIGMGFSGGFPGSVKAELGGELDSRWNNEFGGFLADLKLRNRRCWPTNLKKHPLTIKLFPPIPRPSLSATLKAHCRDWKIIKIRRSKINDFLKSCGAGGIEGEKMNHTFDEWFPENLEQKPMALKPICTERDGYVDVRIDLSIAEDIPVAYFAEVDCGWE